MTILAAIQIPSKLWRAMVQSRSLGSGLVAGTLTLSAGTLVGQGITATATPILARLYSPEDFGVLATFSFLLSVALIIGSLRYELAIPIPEKELDALTLLGLCFLLTTAWCVLAAVAVLLLQFPLSDVVPLGHSARYLWLFPPGILMVCLYQALSYYALRKKNFSCIAGTKILQGGSSSLAQIVGGCFGTSAWGLLAGYLLGQGAGISSLWRKTGLGKDPSLWREVVYSAAVVQAKRYSRFPKYTVPSGVLNTVSQNLLLVFLTTNCGLGAAGYLAVATRIILAPISILGGSIGQVFLSTAAEDHRNRLLRPRVQSAFTALLALALPAFIYLGIAAPHGFDLILGSHWIEAGYMVRALGPWLLVVAVASPLSILPNVLDAQKGEFFFQASLLIARVGSLLPASDGASALQLVQRFSAVSAVWWAGYTVWLMCLAGSSSRFVFRTTATMATKNLPLLLTLVVMEWLVPETSAKHSVVLVVGGILTAILIARQYTSYLKPSNG
jgi:O-antigen/teichoic acid export membrane protein